MKKDTEGHLHPITHTIRDLHKIFADMGFNITEGPEIETEEYNFDLLNIPAHHPARDMWDTFWLKPENSRMLLRTHTSPVQARYMQKNQPPIRIIAPGKTFRYEATDATHEAQFYQIEGLVIDESTSLATLKTTLTKVFSEFFGNDSQVRFRPSFFPFVEPGVEIDMSCFACKRDGSHCSVCKGEKWVEIMGAGMVHPDVLRGVGIDPEKYQGFAFGGGVDRFAMLKYGINDIRELYTGDLRVTNQF